jgi:hypothetical protein
MRILNIALQFGLARCANERIETQDSYVGLG